ncbi:MAG: hypothetical protein VW985_10035 [Gammaproteobacteria bacterium]
MLMAYRAHIAEYGIDMNNLSDMPVEPSSCQGYQCLDWRILSLM